MWYSWKYGHLSSGFTTRCPANQSDAKLLEGGVEQEMASIAQGTLLTILMSDYIKRELVSNV